MLAGRFTIIPLSPSVRVMPHYSEDTPCAILTTYARSHGILLKAWSRARAAVTPSSRRWP